MVSLTSCSYYILYDEFFVLLLPHKFIFLHPLVHACNFKLQYTLVGKHLKSTLFSGQDTMICLCNLKICILRNFICHMLIFYLVLTFTVQTSAV